MNESKSMPNVLENAILKQLSIHHAIGEVKLFEMVSHQDNPNSEENRLYQTALSTLYRKKIIDIVVDPTNTLSVIRLINILH